MPLSVRFLRLVYPTPIFNPNHIPAPSRFTWGWGWERDVEMYPLAHRLELIIVASIGILSWVKLYLQATNIVQIKLDCSGWIATGGQEPIFLAPPLPPHAKTPSFLLGTLEMEGVLHEGHPTRQSSSKPSPLESGYCMWVKVHLSSFEHAHFSLETLVRARGGRECIWSVRLHACADICWDAQQLFRSSTIYPSTLPLNHTPFTSESFFCVFWPLGNDSTSPVSHNDTGD